MMALLGQLRRIDLHARGWTDQQITDLLPPARYRERPSGERFDEFWLSAQVETTELQHHVGAWERVAKILGE